MLQQDSPKTSRSGRESRTRALALTLSAIGAGFIIFTGTGYLLAPQSMAANFGLPTTPDEAANGFLNIKGVRDIATGLVILAVLATRQYRAVGPVTLAIALIPTGDMLTILLRRGSTVTALSVHGLTAALVAATGLLWMHTMRSRRTTHRSTNVK
ncbi:DUF4267 domain-containing protein [Nocardia yamanashiensis]|uniref:DUF4267 domain-containing protein n=1 Tax=Nocardia yamanashiensis TaxID=209247 RepID=UPI000A682822|nr:DUF4267 domain-containing protein [Nocardia yamanashiensis]